MPNIGIPLRYNRLSDGRCILFLGEKIRRCIQKAGSFVVPIVPVQDLDYMDTHYNEYPELTTKEKENIEKYLDMIDGIIFPGGNKITPFDQYLVKRCIERDIPTLGICLGMQLLCYYDRDFKPTRIEEENHYQESDDLLTHKIMVKKDSYLYKILEKDEIMVNSFHNYHADVNNEYSVNAMSEDGYIEGVELKDKKFNLGIQWHPEISYDFDENSRKIIDYFINICSGYSFNEKDYDSSINEYQEEYKQGNYTKQLEWDMAIGLQKVDGLEPSKYLEKLKNDNINDILTIEDVEKELKEYYSSKDNKINHDELECDFVSTRIVELLEENNFELSIEYLKYTHQYLFQDVYDFAGEFRTIDFSKQEKILNNDSVAYGSYNSLKESLDYDISLEQEKNYNEMNITEVINNITKFSSSIWQVHPFREGNTRTIALFIEKYLIDLGYKVDNRLFKEKSVYFRNALVRSNYFNNDFNIKEDNTYLIKFYENLLLGKNHNLHSKDLIVKELFNDKG